MKLKRVLSVVLALVMCVSLAACGGSGDSSEGGSGSSDEPLQVAIWDNNQLDGIKEIADDFTEATGIKTEILVVPWDEYWTMLEAGAQGGSLPDVFWMHSNESERYMSNDMLLDLTDYIEQSETIDLNNYYSDITELYMHDGKNYAIPKDYDTIALWYNKTMFDEAGIAYPDETWTWQTLADTAKALTKDDGSQYGFALPAINNQDGYYNIIYDMGGYIINDDKTKSGWDDPKTIEAMNWLYDNVVTVSMPTPETMTENTADVLMNSGKIAMTMMGSWMVAAFADNEYASENCDVAVLPMADDGTRKSIYNGLGWVASAGTDKPEEAWKLLEYFGSKEAQTKQAELGVTMSAYQGTSDSWVNCAPQFNLQPYLDMTEDMVIRPYSRTTLLWENYSQETMVKAYTGQMTMEEVCKDIANYMNEQLASEQ